MNNNIELRVASDKKIKTFKSWLISQGLELRPPTNPYEVFRFISSRGPLVLYKGARGYSGSSPLVGEAFDCFVSGKKLPWKGKPGKRLGGSVMKRALLNRDGDECFYCGCQLTPNIITQEHLLSILHGGNNRIENQVLACQSCNLEAGHLSIVEKIALRDSKRLARSVALLPQRLRA